MAFVDWSDDYATGIDLIDADHKTLFATVNMLHDRAKTGLDANTVGRAVDVLVMYVDRHFAREEALMERNDYPDLVAHMAQHRRIAAQVHGFRTAFEENLDAIDIDPFLDFLADWLTGHILKRDMDYVPHIDAPATA